MASGLLTAKPVLSVQEVHKCGLCNAERANALERPCPHSFCNACLTSYSQQNPRYGDWRKGEKGYPCPRCESKHFEDFTTVLTSLEMNMIGPDLVDVDAKADDECSFCKCAMCEDCIIVRVPDRDILQQEHTLIGLSGSCSVIDLQPWFSERNEKKKREIKTSANFSAEDRKMLEDIQPHQLLSMLLHAKRCLARGKMVPPCQESYCDILKVTIIHKDECTRDPLRCEFPLCRPSKEVWKHWVNCKAEKWCVICRDQALLAK